LKDLWGYSLASINRLQVSKHWHHQDTIVAIASESGAHIQIQVFHLFLCHTQKQIDTVITKDSFQKLVDVVIANPIGPN
jgi:hypothetical protein